MSGIPLVILRMGFIGCGVGAFFSAKYIFQKDIDEWALLEGYAKYNEQGKLVKCEKIEKIKKEEEIGKKVE